MTKLSEMLQETTQFILDKGVKEIDFGLILGSGLGELADEIEDAVMISYDEIPFFPVSTVVGHAGKLVYGSLAGKKVLAMQGRFHYYEGHSMQTVTYPVRVMAGLGAHS
ncbi:TPA: purine-nucleoside phosphorylase, partial [Enterococcus faecium]|nr:purine-nucleoside phosphorylase [Enterococcus faecium]HEG1058769.1 purine-nucleoside phosphorylase [Enterococcus faecium]